MSAITMKNVYTAQPGVADTELYACPANTIATVKKCVATNDTTTASTMTFNKVSSGDAVGDANLIMNARAIGNKETYECPEVVGGVLDAGDSLSAKMGHANQITVSVDVVEVVQNVS